MVPKILYAKIAQSFLRPVTNLSYSINARNMTHWLHKWRTSHQCDVKRLCQYLTQSIHKVDTAWQLDTSQCRFPDTAYWKQKWGQFSFDWNWPRRPFLSFTDNRLRGGVRRKMCHNYVIRRPYVISSAFWFSHSVQCHYSNKLSSCG